jgi:L-fuconolactonase
MTFDKDSWLNMTVEEVIDPEIQICDAHHHLMDRDGEVYMLENFLTDIRAGHNILQTVYIDCGKHYRQEGPVSLRPVGETEYANNISGTYTKSSGSVEISAGIVAFAELILGDAVKPVLEAHLEVGGKRVRGIRYSCIFDSDPKLTTNSPPKIMLDSKFRQGVSCLQKYRLSLDIFAYFHQLPEVLALANAFPDTTIIIDHLGGLIGIGSYEGKRQEIFDHWKSLIADLASCPNVYIKLGGMGSKRCGWGFNTRQKPPTSLELAQLWGPYFSWCIEKFGPQRCMFESNFPPDRLSCSYIILWNAFKRVIKDYSASEKKALLHDTAVLAYRL